MRELPNTRTCRWPCLSPSRPMEDSDWPALKEAIEQVDEATSTYPCYYIINCAHPTHFERRLAAGEPWVERIRGLRANASRMSHAELNDAPELDIGNPAELGL